ncbi:hypothetical protein NCS52_01104300 [Fusarium sp. LHS14.1]|nr:hypothetical protein NCS52_01104300 [Fusarium sp. LHS14.1]
MDEFTRGAFGQLVPIGTLYDAKSDSFLATSFLRDGLPFDAIASRGINSAEIAHNASAKYEARFKTLGVSHDTAASILSGAIKPQGSSVYLQASFDTVDSLHVVFHHTFTIVKEVLNLKSINVKRHVDGTPLRTLAASHVVTGITWGTRNTIAMTHDLEPDSERSDAQRALPRDLGRIAGVVQSIKGDIFSMPPEATKMELEYRALLYTDSPNMDTMQDSLDTIHRFVCLDLANLHKVNGGKGCPLSYTLLPIDRLNRLLPGVGTIRVASISLTLEDFTLFMNLFNECASCELKLASMLPLVKAGAVHFQRLQELCSLFDAEATAPKHLSTIIGQETGKFDFLSKAIAAGAIYVGHRVSPQERIKTPPNDLGCYALLFNAAAVRQEKWAEHRQSLMLRLWRAGRDRPVYVIDCDASFCRLELDEARLTTYQSGRELITELVGQPQDAPTKGFDGGVHSSFGAKGNDQGHSLPLNNFNWQFPDTQDIDDHDDDDDDEESEDSEESSLLADYCLARYGSDRSNTIHRSDTKEGCEPLDRRFVKIPCPGMRCDHNTPREWTCFHCFELLEFCMTDNYVYCDCGQHLYSDYDFKCDGDSHGPGFDRYPAHTLLDMLRNSKPLESDSINILILGETGVGKSTFINGFVNYLKYNTLDEAMRAEKLTALIPCSFSTQIINKDDPNQEIEERVIQAGDDSREDERDGTKGESATQQTNVYPITIGTTTYRLVDTPGIGDTRKYDKQNMADMMKTLSDYDVLHGILILFKSNSPRLNVLFRFCIQELLTHLHLSAVSNLVFGFANTRISNYAPGDVYAPLKKLLEEQPRLNLSLRRSNVYGFDSESFRYLAAHFEGVPLPNIDGMRKSWAHSKEESQRLVDHFRSTVPHNVNSTLSMNGARQQVVNLMRPMSEISHHISTSLSMLREKTYELRTMRLQGDELLAKLHPEVVQPRMKKLEKPRTVCTHPDCCKSKKVGKGGNEEIKIHKKICHADCKLTNVTQETLADPALLKCRAFDRGKRDKCNAPGCRHPWQLHMHILYEVETVLEKVKDEEIERMIYHNEGEVAVQQKAFINAKTLVNEYQDELKKMQEARAWFVVFLTKNAMGPINDATVEYLDMLIQDDLAKIEAGKELGLSFDKNEERLEALRKERQQHLDLVEAFKQAAHKVQDHQQLTQKGIQELVESLYNLKHSGKKLKSLESISTSSHKATLRERPFRVSRPGGKRSCPQRD